MIVAQLKLVAAPAAAPSTETQAALGPNEMARLLAELDRAWGGADRELGARAAKCIRELIQQKEQATALMLESSALLRTALTRLHALRALI
jgi:hypothetical protein